MKTSDVSLKIGKVVQIFQISEFKTSWILVLSTEVWSGQSLSWFLPRTFMHLNISSPPRISGTSVSPRAHTWHSRLSTLEIIWMLVKCKLSSHSDETSVHEVRRDHVYRVPQWLGEDCLRHK